MTTSRHSSDNQPPVHEIRYIASSQVREVAHRWIEVSDDELATVREAATHGPEVLASRLDALWQTAWNSGVVGEDRAASPVPGDEPRTVLTEVVLPDGPVDLTADGFIPATVSAERTTDVHTEHCCAIHGCKYAKGAECTVVGKGLRQSYPCEMCEYDHVVWSVRDLDRAADGVVAVNATGQGAQKRDGVWLLTGSVRPRTSEEFIGGSWVRLLTEEDD